MKRLITDKVLHILAENLSFSDYILVTKDISDLEVEIERLNNIIKEQGLEDKPNYYVKGLEGSIKEYQEEVKRLNNIIKQQDTRNSRQRIANRKLLERNQDLVIENLKSNNIINELEKHLIEEIKDYDKHINSKFITAISKEQYEGEKVCFEDMLGRLQELKGSDK